MIILVFLVTALFLKNNLSKNKFNWKGSLLILGVMILLSIIILGVGGIGELFWQHLKSNQIYYAHPGLFLLAGVVCGLGALLFLANWLPKLPLARDSSLYWLTGTVLLLIGSLGLALIRVDLAFPFVFWLLCFDLLLYSKAWVPSFALVLAGPYFICRLHYELLNSEQWISYCEAMQKYPLIFFGIYTLLLVPFLLSVSQAAFKLPAFARKVIPSLKIPALAGTGVIILALGLVPSYTKAYPQTVTVQEEWSGSNNGKLHIFAADRLPDQLVKTLGGQPGKSIVLAAPDQKPPLSITSSLDEKHADSQRLLEVVLHLDYRQEPYLIGLNLQSSQPFEVVTDEFLPLAKLPKMLQLKGTGKPGEGYSLFLQRTPPQKNTIHLTIKAKGLVTCTLTGTFPYSALPMQIQNDKISVDYLAEYKENYTF